MLSIQYWLSYWSIILFGKIRENMDCIKSHSVNYYYLHQGGYVFSGRHGEVRRSLINIWSEVFVVDVPAERNGCLSLVLADQQPGFFFNSYIFFFSFWSVNTSPSSCCNCVTFFKSAMLKRNQTNWRYEICHHSLPNQKDSAGQSWCESALTFFFLLVTTFQLLPLILIE